MKELYIIGAGGFGREVAWLVERINETEKIWDLKGFIDDNKDIWGIMEDDYPVIGGCDFFETIQHDVWVVCAVGSAKVRKKIIEKIEQYTHVHFGTVIDPTAQISKRVTIGEGTIICAGNIITVDIAIGRHNIINLDCTIGHDAILHDYVTVYPSVNISGNSEVGECSELGTGMQIIQGKKVGNNSILGAGAVVIKDIPDNCVAVGSPATVKKTIA